ncbi:hypothetical protein B0H10DRAFT_2428165 [Mycena sp. CBHHK59/15]|nr:hypothetical protein B0H10DRAFT_2428165 [Mycena sp. CBHHK59/15]
MHAALEFSKHETHSEPKRNPTEMHKRCTTRRRNTTHHFQQLISTTATKFQQMPRLSQHRCKHGASTRLPRGTMRWVSLARPLVPPNRLRFPFWRKPRDVRERERKLRVVRPLYTPRRGALHVQPAPTLAVAPAPAPTPAPTLALALAPATTLQPIFSLASIPALTPVFFPTFALAPVPVPATAPVPVPIPSLAPSPAPLPLAVALATAAALLPPAPAPFAHMASAHGPIPSYASVRIGLDGCDTLKQVKAHMTSGFQVSIVGEGHEFVRFVGPGLERMEEEEEMEI